MKNLFGSGNNTPAPVPASTAPSFVKESIVDLSKKAEVSLTKAGLVGKKFAVYLVLDYSASMGNFYRNGSVSALVDRSLGLARKVDDDGNVPVIYFGKYAERPIDVDLNNHEGFVKNHHPKNWHYNTLYAPPIKAVTAHYKQQYAGSGIPGLVYFQTDGFNADVEEAKEAMRDASEEMLFFNCLGYGGKDPEKDFPMLNSLDDLSGRRVDNAKFFHYPEPETVTSDRLYGDTIGTNGDLIQWVRHWGI
jgi:hypothetical protein